MPMVVPSLVVEAIDRSGIDLTRDIGADCAGALSAIMHLVRSLAPYHYVALTPGEYALFVSAVALVESETASWQQMSLQDQKHYGPALRKEQPLLEGRSPLEVVRATLDKCPDDAAAVHTPELAFLNDSALAGVLRSDMSAATSALGNGEYKAACVMAGSVIEALLLWALKQKTSDELEHAREAWAKDQKAKSTAPSQLPKDWNDWKLFQLIEIGRQLGLVSPPVANAAEAAKDFRNLIHPERADKARPTLGMAQIAVGVMQRLAEELEARTQTKDP